MPSKERQSALFEVITQFLTERLNTKLEKLHEDDPKRVELNEQFSPETWIADAARRVRQIQGVTHSLKAIHPDARGTCLFCAPSSLPASRLLGTHALGPQFDLDVVGNAAALDVYKFLRLEHAGQTLLDLCLNDDEDLARAMSDNEEQGHAWMQVFSTLVKRDEVFRSHRQAKQTYWPLGENPHDDTDYHLLAPLYPTSLVQRIYTVIQDDRFGEDAKAAREARKRHLRHNRVLHDYPSLAVQQLGGSKPQNISQLNSERHGTNYLLASIPPVWKISRVRPALGVTSLFDAFRYQGETRQQLRVLRTFLGTDPVRNRDTRAHRDALIESILDELIQFTATIRTLPPGWSQEPECTLKSAHRQWLDPAEDVDPQDSLDTISEDFANWLNHRLRDPLPMGDPEYLYWRKLAREQLQGFCRENA